MPDGYPASKHPHTNGHASQTTSHRNNLSPSMDASQLPEPLLPIPAAPYQAAHPSYETAPMQYPEAAWAPEQQYGYGYGSGQGGQQAGAWQAYDPSGYNGNAAWEPAPAHHQHNWYPANVSLLLELCVFMLWSCS